MTKQQQYHSKDPELPKKKTKLLDALKAGTDPRLEETRGSEWPLQLAVRKSPWRRRQLSWT